MYNHMLIQCSGGCWLVAGGSKQLPTCSREQVFVVAEEAAGMMTPLELAA
jgi:hypothetical protein